MEVFKQLKETLGCGATGVIVHLIENYQPPTVVSPSEVQTVLFAQLRPRVNHFADADFLALGDFA